LSEIAELSALLALIYLSECVAWIRRGTLALRALGATDFAPALASKIVGNARGGFVWLNPVPPLGTLFVSQAWPIALAPDGLCTLEPVELERGERESFERAALAWSDVRDVRTADRQLLVNGVAYARCETAEGARALARLVESVRDLARDLRGPAIERALGQALDVPRVTELAARFAASVRIVRPLSNSLFVLLAAVAPLVLQRFGIARTWPWLLGTLLALHGATVSCFVRARRELGNEFHAGWRMQLVIMALSPLQAIRAADLLARPLFAGVHPLAALALAGEGQRKRLARALLVDARFPRASGDERDQFGAGCERWFRARLLAALEASAREQGLDPVELLAPPAPDDASKSSYCPRCALQVDAHQTACPDCRAPLQRFTGR
jgi:hypothetical protein